MRTSPPTRVVPTAAVFFPMPQLLRRPTASVTLARVKE